ncbi:MAG: hypothetical protein KJO69_05075 [Gammaproteobacteria bacterium]|nr:hypothetical protein [Gammaproteobacteria bacterium]
MSVTSTELLLMVEEIERSMDYLECMKDILHDTTRMNDIRKMHFEVKQFLQTLSKSKAMKVKNV